MRTLHMTSNKKMTRNIFKEVNISQLNMKRDTVSGYLETLRRRTKMLNANQILELYLRKLETYS